MKGKYSGSSKKNYSPNKQQVTTSKTDKNRKQHYQKQVYSGAKMVPMGKPRSRTTLQKPPYNPAPSSKGTVFPKLEQLPTKRFKGGSAQPPLAEADHGYWNAQSPPLEPPQADLPSKSTHIPERRNMQDYEDYIHEQYLHIKAIEEYLTDPIDDDMPEVDALEEALKLKVEGDEMETIFLDDITDFIETDAGMIEELMPAEELVDMPLDYEHPETIPPEHYDTLEPIDTQQDDGLPENIPVSFETLDDRVEELYEDTGGVESFADGIDAPDVAVEGELLDEPGEVGGLESLLDNPGMPDVSPDVPFLGGPDGMEPDEPAF